MEYAMMLLSVLTRLVHMAISYV